MHSFVQLTCVVICSCAWGRHNKEGNTRKKKIIHSQNFSVTFDAMDTKRLNKISFPADHWSSQRRGCNMIVKRWHDMHTQPIPWNNMRSRRLLGCSKFIQLLTVKRLVSKQGILHCRILPIDIGDLQSWQKLMTHEELSLMLVFMPPPPLQCWFPNWENTLCYLLIHLEITWHQYITVFNQHCPGERGICNISRVCLRCFINFLPRL